MPEAWAASWDALPPFPERTPRLLARIRRIARRMGKKSTGLDGRHAAEVALLPDEILQVACELLDLIEREQYWPD
eukprot:744998-Lingulodinium_polyedra.AAC.1